MKLQFLHFLCILAAVGCGRSSADIERDCEATVSRYRKPAVDEQAKLADALRQIRDEFGHHDYIRAVAARNQRNNAKLADVLFKRCSEDQWDKEMRTCIANDDPGCPTKLPPSQFKKFDADFTAANELFIAEKKADRNPWSSSHNGTCGSVTEAIRIALRAIGEKPASLDFELKVMRVCQHWHFTALNCLEDVGTLEGMKACDKYLSPEQQTEFHHLLATRAEQ
jgi:hypothetical protein